MIIIEQKAITSLEVSEMVEKEHKELLRDIRRYIQQLAESKIALGDFFNESKYQDANNQTRPCYLVTKKGCEFIAHKLIGIKGAGFTAKYINRFHEMEEVIRKPMSAIQLIELQLEAIKEVDIKIDALDTDLQAFKKDMPLLGLECDKITFAVRKKGVSCLGGKESEAYQDKSLRGQVYSDIYGQLKREFAVSSYKALKRSQTDLALSIVNNYKLPLALRQDVGNCNDQLRFIK